MNRNEEFRDYLDSFGDTPPELEYTLTRARARLKARRRRAIFAPLGTLCAFALCFVGLVNMSESFASACYDIPVLRQLAAAVDFSPSLSRAVENDYVQELGLEQTVNGIDCRIEYVIVDGAQLNVFFTLSGGEKLLVDSQVLQSSGERFGSVACGGPTNPDENGLYRQRAEFINGDMPGELLFSLNVYEGSDKNRAAQFNFRLEFDPDLTAQPEVIELNREFETGGQTLIFRSAEIYPTHMRLNFAASEGNSAWLDDIELYVTDGDGNVYDSVGSGITSFGTGETPDTDTWQLESPYFVDCDSLTLHITGAVWLDKDAEPVMINLATLEHGELPQGVELNAVEDSELGTDLNFVYDTALGMPFGSYFTDGCGEEHFISSSYTSSSVRVGDEFVDLPEGKQIMGYYLDGCGDSVVFLEPLYTHSTQAETEISLKIK